MVDARSRRLWRNGFLLILWWTLAVLCVTHGHMEGGGGYLERSKLACVAGDGSQAGSTAAGGQHIATETSGGGAHITGGSAGMDMEKDKTPSLQQVNPLTPEQKKAATGDAVKKLSESLDEVIKLNRESKTAVRRRAGKGGGGSNAAPSSSSSNMIPRRRILRPRRLRDNLLRGYRPRPLPHRYDRIYGGRRGLRPPLRGRLTASARLRGRYPPPYYNDGYDADFPDRSTAAELDYFRRAGVPLDAITPRRGGTGSLIRREEAMHRVASALGIDGSSSRGGGTLPSSRLESYLKHRAARREAAAGGSQNGGVSAGSREGSGAGSKAPSPSVHVQKEIESLKKGIRHLKKTGDRQAKELKQQLALKDRQINMLLNTIDAKQLQQQLVGVEATTGASIPNSVTTEQQQPNANNPDVSMQDAAGKRQCVVNVRRKDGSRAAQFKLGFKGQTSPDSLRKAVAQHMQVDASKFSWFRGPEEEASGELTLLLMT